MAPSSAKKHLIFLAPRAADPVVTALVARLSQPPPASHSSGGAWDAVTTTIVATRAPVALCCRPGAMHTSSLAGVPIEEVSGVYVGALPPRVPGLAPTAPVPPEKRLLVQQAADGRRDALCALLAYLAATGRPVLNPPVGGTLLQNKLEHLQQAAVCGLSVLPTVAGDEAAAEALLNAGPAIDKPIRAWTPTLPAQGPLPAGLMRQRRVFGTPVRVLLLDGAVLDAVRIEGTRTVDHRADPAFSAGQARYVPVEVPANILAPLRALLKALHLRFAGVDFLLDDDRWWFLEANAAPIWVEQAERTHRDVAGALVSALLGPPAL